jgi:hypothetical protein
VGLYDVSLDTTQSSMKTSLVLVAARVPEVDILEFLREYQDQFVVQLETNNAELTPLHIALIFQNYPVLVALLEHWDGLDMSNKEIVDMGPLLLFAADRVCSGNIMIRYTDN